MVSRDPVARTATPASTATDETGSHSPESTIEPAWMFGLSPAARASDAAKVMRQATVSRARKPNSPSFLVCLGRPADYGMRSVDAGNDAGASSDLPSAHTMLQWGAPAAG